MINVKKGDYSFLAPENVTRFGRASNRWIRELSKQRPELVTWARGLPKDQDVTHAMLELAHRYDVDALELLNFLAHQRTVHWSSRELRAKLRRFGKRWRDVELLAAKALEESEVYLEDLREKAVEIEHTAKQLSQSFIKPAAKRLIEQEIGECKEAIRWFLKQCKVKEVNEFGWILLRAVFGPAWKAGRGRDQIAAFRAIPKPFIGKVKDRKGFEIVMERAKLSMHREYVSK